MEPFDLSVRLFSHHRAVSVLVGSLLVVDSIPLSLGIESTKEAVLYCLACFAMVAAVLTWLLGARSE